MGFGFDLCSGYQFQKISLFSLLVIFCLLTATHLQLYRERVVRGEVCFENAESVKVLFNDFRGAYSSLTIYKN